MTLLDMEYKEYKEYKTCDTDSAYQVHSYSRLRVGLLISVPVFRYKKIYNLEFDSAIIYSDSSLPTLLASYPVSLELHLVIRFY